MCTAQREGMISSKLKDLMSSYPQDSNSDTNDEEKNELYPRSKDVDDFVKVICCSYNYGIPRHQHLRKKQGFHGADSDIEWLHRDFGLYVVNLLDTHQASRALNLAGHSLTHLLKHLCNVDADKRYQLADWRIRPLPDEMVQYARTDTHYLLYIYDCVRAQLLDFNHGQPGLLQSVWNKSKGISLKKYVKPIYTDELYLKAQRKQKKAFNTQQLTAFRLLFAWRDKLARQEDESTRFVLPTHMMSKISEELPKEPQGIIVCRNPVPPLVRQYINELHVLVQQAREMPLLKMRKDGWHAS